MPSLSDILEKKPFIKKAADLFGFENIRIYYHNEEEEETLNLLVSNIKEKENYHAAFEAALGDILDCQTVILSEQELKEFYKEDILSNSVPIDDEGAIKKLFSVSFNEVHFISSSNDKGYQISQQRALNLAKEIVEENTKQTFTDFFKLRKAQDTGQKRKRLIAEIGEVGEECFSKISKIAEKNGVKMDHFLIEEFLSSFKRSAEENGILIEGEYTGASELVNKLV